MSLVFDRQALEEQWTAAASEVLETMFFTGVEWEVLDPEPAEPGSRIGAALEFHGACAGRLALSLEREAAESLANSFFGGPGEDGPEEDCRSVMAGLTNMVCGAMLSHLDKKSIFCLDSPQPLAALVEMSGDIEKNLRLEVGLLRLAFSLEGAEQA